MLSTNYLYMYRTFSRGFIIPFRIMICLLLLITITSFNSLMSQVTFAIAGLTHDHVNGILQQYKNRQVNIIGIAESDKKLVARYSQRFSIPDSLIYDDLSSLLEKEKPDAVMAFNAISEHL